MPVQQWDAVTTQRSHREATRIAPSCDSHQFQHILEALQQLSTALQPAGEQNRQHQEIMDRLNALSEALIEKRGSVAIKRLTDGLHDAAATATLAPHIMLLFQNFLKLFE